MKPGDRYWDSSVFLALLIPEEDRLPACDVVITAAQNGECRIITSTFTLTEVIHVRGRKRLDQRADEQIRELFLNDYIKLREVDRYIGEKARQLLWQFPKLSPKDAVHVATAAATNTIRIDTYDDKDFGPLNGIISCDDGRLIAIGRPDLAGQTSLGM